jgi:hypothetical protein
MGPIGCPATSVTYYQCTLRNITAERISPVTSSLPPATKKDVLKAPRRVKWLQQSFLSDFWRNTGHITYAVHIDRTITVTETPATVSHAQPTFKMKYPYLCRIVLFPTGRHATRHVYPILFGLITRIKFGEQYASWNSFLYYFPHFPVAFSQLPFSALYSQCERPSSTPIQNDRKNCGSVSYGLYICR